MILTTLQKQILTIKQHNIGFDINNKDELEKFLNPNFDLNTFDGSKITDMFKSVKRLKRAINDGEKIVIYSDYDCDGIPGAIVIHDFLKKIKYDNFINYIPHRHNEGYGLNKKAIQKFIDQKFTLMITVDCGITNIDEIKFAEENNLNVILTDHHLPILNKKHKQILPPAYAVINTKRDDCNYEEKFLCGCATAWKLVNSFLNKYRNDYGVVIGWEKWLLDMVGISTIADMVPLQNENRILAKYGLEVLKKSKRPGLQKILKNSKINQQNIKEEDISFGIAPRLNAASRIAEPMQAFYTLLQNETALDFAENLEKFNNERKKNTKEAELSIDYENFKNKKIILIGNKKWGPGIIGLVAGKISERTGKTTFVWGMGEDENIMKGSVRAGKDNLNVVQLMAEVKNKDDNILINFGGHEAAGGFVIHKNNLEKFEEFLNTIKIKNNKKDELVKILNLNENETISKNIIEIKINEISQNLYNEINIFAPFGVGNEKVSLKIKNNKNIFITNKRFGKEKEHLEIKLKDLESGKEIKAIQFFADEEFEKNILQKNEWLFNLDWDNFRNDLVLKFVKS